LCGRSNFARPYICLFRYVEVDVAFNQPRVVLYGGRCALRRPFRYAQMSTARVKLAFSSGPRSSGRRSIHEVAEEDHRQRSPLRVSSIMEHRPEPEPVFTSRRHTPRPRSGRPGGRSYPRRRGDDAADVHSAVADRELPPQARGRPVPTPADADQLGATPAGAGTTTGGCTRKSCLRSYPRRRGDDTS
jgi:hypothetical protein